jgi:hypothetical protein
MVTIATVVVLHAALKLYGHSEYGTGFDSSVFGNISWRLANGIGDISTLTGFPHFGSHFSGILFLFLPVFRWWPDLGLPIVFVTQAASVGLIGWAIWRLSHYYKLNPKIRWVLLAGILLSPGALFATRLEVHEPTLTLGALAMTISTSLRGVRLQRMWWWAVIAAAGRIEMAAATFVVGVLLLGARRRPWGLLAGGVGLVVMIGTLVYMTGSNSDPSLSAHFGHLGSSPLEILRNAITAPGVTFGPLGSATMWVSVVFWLLPFGLIAPFSGWRWLLPALPSASVAIFGSWESADAFIHHYWYALLVGAPVAAATGLRDARSLRSRYPMLGLAGLVAAWAITAPFVGGLRLTGINAADDLDRLASHVRDLPRTGVAVSGPIVPHIIDRPDIYFYPRPFACADIQFGPFNAPAMMPEFVAILSTEIDPTSGDERSAFVAEIVQNHYRVIEDRPEYQILELRSPRALMCTPDAAFQ